MAYSRRSTVRVLTTTHVVDFYAGVSAKDLADWLQSVPSAAVVVDVGMDDENRVTIKFQEEARAEAE